MARLARVIVPNCQHHVIRRGNRRQKTFSELICMVSPDSPQHHVIRRGNRRQKTFSELICMVSPDSPIIRRGNRRQKTFSELICMVSPDSLYGVPRFPGEANKGTVDDAAPAKDGWTVSTRHNDP